jgi:hypothetical protein|tara:strand:+ start:361 stop:537 length:177 start_codon:yes stop_codon:yes gene_type:complete
MDKFKYLLIFIGLRMFNFQSFIVGTVSGIYIAQNYDIPNVKKLGDKVVDYIKNFEKKD